MAHRSGSSACRASGPTQLRRESFVVPLRANPQKPMVIQAGNRAGQLLPVTLAPTPPPTATRSDQPLSQPAPVPSDTRRRSLRLRTPMEFAHPVLIIFVASKVHVSARFSGCRLNPSAIAIDFAPAAGDGSAIVNRFRPSPPEHRSADNPRPRSAAPRPAARCGWPAPSPRLGAAAPDIVLPRFRALPAAARCLHLSGSPTPPAADASEHDLPANPAYPCLVPTPTNSPKPALPR